MYASHINSISTQNISKNPMAVFAVRNPCTLARFHSEFFSVGLSLQGKSLMLTPHLFPAMLTTQAFLLFTCHLDLAT